MSFTLIIQEKSYKTDILNSVCVFAPAGLQDGRPLDLLHQSDADHHEQAAAWPGPEQVNFLLAGGHGAHPPAATYWSALQLGADLRPPPVEDEPQSFC